MPQLSQRLPWLILKEIAAFFLSFILYLNIFCKKLNHSMLHDLKSVILYIAIISHIPQIHQTAFTTDTYQVNGWEAVSVQLIFRLFLTNKER